MAHDLQRKPLTSLRAGQLTTRVSPWTKPWASLSLQRDGASPTEDGGRPLPLTRCETRGRGHVRVATAVTTPSFSKDR